jgi:uncharacterized membrane protein required for colicin V production
MALDRLPLGWFDFAAVIVLLVGVLRGRKNGMSEELMPLLQWAVILGACAYLYQPAGALLAQEAGCSLLFAYIAAYLILAAAVKGVFTFLKRATKGKLIGSDFFGRSEYYLGMAAGMVRFACGLMMALALLNARLFSSAEVIAMQKFQVKEYGSEFFPTIQTLQQQVFEKSFIGSRIKEPLKFLLIKPTVPEVKQLRRKELELP